MPFEFPYTDLHEINLNKFVKAIRNLLGGHGGELLQKQSNIPFDYAWKPVTGLSAVNSVNGMTGNVTLTAADVGAIPNTTPIPEPANNLPADLGVAYRGTSLKYARMDHIHKMPTASDVGALPVGTTIPLPGLNAPEDLGTAYRGTATRYSREDHVHNMPSASDVGALADTTLYAGSQTAGGPADKAVSIPMGALDASSTSTVMKATVPGITELRNGVLMWLRNGVITSASGVTLNINNLGAKPIYSSQSASSAITTLFNINYTALMIFNEDRVAGGCWDYVYGYDSNTNTIGYQIRTYAQSLPMQSVTYRYRLLFTSKDHKHFVPANNSTSTNSTTARTPCQDPIDPFGPLYYYGTTASVAAGTRPSTSYLWQQYSPITLGYSFTGYTLTAFEPVFLVCTPNADGSAVINSSNPITQTLPNTEDGKIYILLGVATTTTQFELILNHPVYQFKNGKIGYYTGQEDLPPVTVADDGKVLTVVNGVWTAVDAPIFHEYVGTVVGFNTASPVNIQKLQVAYEPVQTGSGDPSPNNVRPITGYSNIKFWVKSSYDATLASTVDVTIPADPGTVYGGTLDAVSGILKVTKIKIAFAPDVISAWYGEDASRTTQGFYLEAADFNSRYPAPAYGPVIFEKYKRDSSYGKDTPWIATLFFSSGNFSRFDARVPKSELGPYANYNECKAAIVTFLASNPIEMCYELATPVLYQLSENTLQTLTGQNYVWSDAGNITIDYVD